MTTKKIRKALNKLNDYIDGEQNKLCDRIKKLESAHKRMMRLLFLVDKLANEDGFDCEISYKIWENQFMAVLQAVHEEVERKVL